MIKIPLLNKQGLTLAELLITTIIIGIVMVGLVSIDFAIRSNEQQQSRTSLATIRTSAVLQDIVTTASQAFGNATTQCVQIGNITTDTTNYICIYRDYGTPSDNSDDSWQCYTRHGTDLHKCTRTVGNGKGSCADTDPIIGTVTADTFDPPDTPYVVATNPDFYFQVTIKSRFDPSRPNPGIGSANANGAKYSVAIAQEFMVNPKVKMTSKITPASCVP
jgi:prepilin-type N-terminal cleavage/methylation domain-containing protein